MILHSKRLSLIVCFASMLHAGFAQLNYTVSRQRKMYLGLSGGMTFSATQVSKSYSMLQATPQSAQTSTGKTYEPLFHNSGSQFGVYFSYSFSKKLSILAQPAYRTDTYQYRTAYTWSDTVNGSDFNQEMLHRQHISSVIIPVALRYDFSIYQFSPYVQAGIYSKFRTRASKTIYYDQTIDQSVDRKTADQTGQTDFTGHTRKSDFGVMAGAGMTFFANYFAISLESNFRYGFGKTISDKNRYADLTGLSVQYLDVQDQFKLYNLDLQLTVMFPLDNSISLGILRKRRY